jgi:hypothetical protein
MVWSFGVGPGCFTGLPLAVRAEVGVAFEIAAGAGFVSDDGRDAGGGATESFDVAEGRGVLVGGGAIIGVMMGAGAIVLMLMLVMSRPARSMATHAVADTPTTAASQIAAMPPAERRLITMSPLCHLPDDKVAFQGTSHNNGELRRTA